MAARFPQSGSSVAYQIKAAYSSKIKVLYWAASADAVHVLRPGDSATTILTRSATGATFNSTDGRISGSSGQDAADHFQDYITGGYADDDDDFSFGFGVYGDLFNGKPAGTGVIVGADHANIIYPGGFVAHAIDTIRAYHRDGDTFGAVPNFTDATYALATIACRYVAADPIAKSRLWANGSEDTAKRSASVPKGTPQTYGTSTRPIYLGWSLDNGEWSVVEWEFAFIGTGDLTDAELDAITADPTVLIEESVAGATITLTDPVAVVTGSTASCTITRSAAASGNITYNLTSCATGIATVPATATILDGQTTGSFNITGVSAGSSTITATNAADSGETDTATANVSALKGLTVTFGQTNLSGLTFAWFDQASPDLFVAPTVVGTTESTDGSGVMEINLTGTSVAVGNTGYLLIYKAGATAPDDIAFFGRLTVQDIG